MKASSINRKNADVSVALAHEFEVLLRLNQSRASKASACNRYEHRLARSERARALNARQPEVRIMR